MPFTECAKEFIFDGKKYLISRDFFMSEVEKIARYAVPFIKNIRLLMKSMHDHKMEDLDRSSGM